MGDKHKISRGRPEFLVWYFKNWDSEICVSYGNTGWDYVAKLSGKLRRIMFLHLVYAGVSQTATVGYIMLNASIRYINISTNYILINFIL